MLRTLGSLLRLPTIGSFRWTVFSRLVSTNVARAPSHSHILPILIPPTISPLPRINPTKPTRILLPSLVSLTPRFPPSEPLPMSEPPPQPTTEKQAARLVVIRRRKMKKHKLRKLRKKMKFELIKISQRRELRKEKAFQAELVAQIKEAQVFDPREYVAGFLKKMKDTKADIDVIRNLKPPKREGV